MKEAVIVASGRSAIGKAFKGSLKYTRPEDFAGQVLTGVLAKTPGIEDKIEDIIVGCAMPEAEQGINLGRILVGMSNLPDHVPGQTVNRFCASGLQSIASGAGQIMAGQSEVIVAGGVETMTMIPMGGNKYVPNLDLMKKYPDYYISMGHTAERVAEKYQISREEMDLFASESHQKAYQARGKGLFEEEIVPVMASTGKNGRIPFDMDEGIRGDSTVEKLGRLKPVFTMNGTVTAGNSSQMSDGASFVTLMERERAVSEGYQAQAKFLSFAVCGCEPGLMGLGPVKAIPEALKKAGLTLDQIGLIELNEAFASQSIACIRELNLDEEKVNVSGGAIAMGHPLGCSGAYLTTKLLHEMKRRKAKYGLVSMCIGGGQGACGIFELL